MLERSAEADLLKEACRGDESAFLAIYERHRECVFRFAYRMLGSVAAAEDITHDCFLSLLQKPHLFNPDRASLRTYLCAAARNLVWKQLRRRGLEIQAEEAAEKDETANWNGPYEALRTSEIADGVRQAVESLPPLQREAIIMFEFDEFSLSDTAIAAQTDIGTIKSRLHRARQRLRNMLACWIATGNTSSSEEMKP